MNTIAELIQKLISSPDVVGLIEYGSARHQDEILRGDYDLVAVLQERSPDVDSLHFHVRATPVDMSIRTLRTCTKPLNSSTLPPILSDRCTSRVS